jgi:hypothetical protein
MENVIFRTPRSGGSDPRSLAPNRGVQTSDFLAPNRGVLKESPRMSAEARQRAQSRTQPAATHRPTPPDRLAELASHWGWQIDLWVNGSFRGLNGIERNLYDETMVTRSAIVRAVIGTRAVSTGWANDTVDAVMNVPAWKRIHLAGTDRYPDAVTVAYRLRNATLRWGEKLAPLA